LKENPFASYFDIQQGYRVLTHTQVGDVVHGCMSPLKFPGLPGLPGLELHRGTRGVPTASGPSCGLNQVSEISIVPPKYMGMGQNLVPLVNLKIAGKWMFITLKWYI